MKKIIGFTLSMIMILTGICVWANDVTVKFNGEPMSFDVNPFIEKDRTLVPMRAIFESVGATVSWDDETRTVIAIMNNQDGFNYVVLQIGSEMAFLDGEGVILDVPARIVNDRTFVPLRFVMENLGQEVTWDESTYTVNITNK